MQGWVLKQGGRWPQESRELCVHDGGEKKYFGMHDDDSDDGDDDDDDDDDQGRSSYFRTMHCCLQLGHT